MRTEFAEADKEIPERTFHNHWEAIRGIFGIEIAFDRGLGYYIDNPEELDGEGIRSWLLHRQQQQWMDCLERQGWPDVG